MQGLNKQNMHNVFCADGRPPIRDPVILPCVGSEDLLNLPCVGSEDLLNQRTPAQDSPAPAPTQVSKYVSELVSE